MQQPHSDRPAARLVAADLIEVTFQIPLSGPPLGAGNSTPGAAPTARAAGSEAVRWGTEVYTFTPRQRLVIAALLDAREQGHVWVSGDGLLEAAESDGHRLRDLFRGHPAWGTLILSGLQAGGRAGLFRLADPEAG